MRSTDRLFGASIALALIFRLALLLIPGAPLDTRLVTAAADAPEYVRLAQNLARHRSFSLDSAPPLRPDIFRTPAYPLLLAPFFAVLRSPLLWIGLAQIVLSLTVIWLTRLLATELGADDRTATVAALLVALSPNLALLATKLITETAFTALLLVALMLLARYAAHARPADLVGAGASFGLLMLTRPIATYLPLAIAACLLVPNLLVRRVRLAAPLVLLAAAAVVVTPWVVRNGRATGRYIISSVAEHNIYLYSGALARAADQEISLAAARDSLLAGAKATFGQVDSTNEAERWAALGQIGWREVLRRPVTSARLHAAGSAASLVMPLGIRPLLAHFAAPGMAEPDNPHVAQQFIALLARGRVGPALALARTERLARLPGAALVLLASAALFNAALLGLALTGILLRRNGGLRWLLVPIGYFILLTGPVGEARFRAPVEPLLAIFAATLFAGHCRVRPAAPEARPVRKD